jgi:alanyl-tRNA synthetase
MPYDDAIKAGALAFFGDKYGDRVRVVRMGDFSVELCGGTHVARTGDIGLFKLEGESGVAAGVRRIEALTGEGALETIRRREQILREINSHLGARDSETIERLERLLAREKELEKTVRILEQSLISGAGSSTGDETTLDLNGIILKIRKNVVGAARAVGQVADKMRDESISSAVVSVSGVPTAGTAPWAVTLTSDLTAANSAADIMKQIGPIVGGSGGGRRDFARGALRDASKLDEALKKVVDSLKR